MALASNPFFFSFLLILTLSLVLDKESADSKVLVNKIEKNLVQKYFSSLQYRTEEG